MKLVKLSVPVLCPDALGADRLLTCIVVWEWHGAKQMSSTQDMLFDHDSLRKKMYALPELL
jgi:hypothetical protein